MLWFRQREVQSQRSGSACYQNQRQRFQCNLFRRQRHHRLQTSPWQRGLTGEQAYFLFHFFNCSSHLHHYWTSFRGTERSVSTLDQNFSTLVLLVRLLQLICLSQWADSTVAQASRRDLMLSIHLSWNSYLVNMVFCLFFHSQTFPRPSFPQEYNHNHHQ